MDSNQYTMDFDDLLEDNPEINPEWRKYMEPVMMDTDEKFYAFIMNYLFM